MAGRLTQYLDLMPRSDAARAGHQIAFWMPELGEWIDATDLQVGRWLQTSAGTWGQITAINAGPPCEVADDSVWVDGEPGLSRRAQDVVVVQVACRTTRSVADVRVGVSVRRGGPRVAAATVAGVERCMSAEVDVHPGSGPDRP